jgi:hypothetical protein
LLFLIPFYLYLILGLIIDPFNVFFEEENKEIKDIKIKTSSKLDYPLFSINKYLKNPTEIILLGDSRTNRLNMNQPKIGNKNRSTNLAYGGGTIPEIVETFWYITKFNDLKEVYVGINFNLYNKNNNNNRVKNTIDLLESNKFTHLLTGSSLKAITLITKSLIFSNVENIEKPDIDKSEFWKIQINKSEKFYQKYNYPENYFNELLAISKHCNQNDIKLIFFSPPTHIDLQNRVDYFNLKKEKVKFMNDLSELGTFIDYDYENELTVNKNNFTDPFHFNDSIAKIITNDILSEDKFYGIVYKTDN